MAGDCNYYRVCVHGGDGVHLRHGIHEQNLVNAIQGFNQVNLSLTNQTNVISQQLQALQAKMDSCCCDIKTLMLQNRLDDANAAKVELQNRISNFEQSQYILGQTGRWVGWAGSGSQAAA